MKISASFMKNNEHINKIMKSRMQMTKEACANLDKIM